MARIVEIRQLAASSSYNEGAAGAAPRSLGRNIWHLTWRRFLLGVLVTAAVSVVTFVLAAASPLDPLQRYLGARFIRTSDAQRSHMAEALGFDRPWWQAWSAWAKHLFSEGGGPSIVYKTDVATVIADRLPWSIVLGGISLVAAVAIALVWGFYAGVHPGGLADRAATAVCSVIQSLPSFVIGVGFIFVLGVRLALLPIGGAYPIGAAPSFHAAYIVMPATVLALTQLPWIVLGIREGAYQAAIHPAIAAARQRGLSARTIMWRHIVPLGLPPAFALIGSRLPELLMGAVVVESLFAWPGIGQALTAAALGTDVNLMATTTLICTIGVLAGMYLADLCHMIVDPGVVADG